MKHSSDLNMNTEACASWKVPDFDHKSAVASESTKAAPLLTAERLEAIQNNAYNEGFQQGLNEGREKGLAQVQQQSKRLEQLMLTLSRPLELLDQQVEESLVTLAISIARQLIRRELKRDPGQIIGVVRDAIKVLPIASGNVQLMLHPDDAGLVRELMSLPEGDRHWSIVEDPSMTSGGCQIVTTDSRIDSSVESRLNAVIASVLGSERQQEAMRES